ncbi:AI-2E family transporter [Prochlorothrix hollandica]|uniref:Membrane protein n=1 Tax=Prochlorothrix hollandica PCC 9006 = CALU 1027 TaxID=317619 RepID=A0A0M2PY21_PROHO|nr:AI-2E family transporter [Prochlorothrix hollandica]KKI99281.1 membrane protein [Prochlorothrix hollandica PCC 9006 = CALU 1027]
MIGQWIGVLGVAVALYILWQIRQILLLIFTAVVLATAANGFVRRVQQLNVPRGRAVLLTLSIFLTFAIIFIALIVPPFLAQFQELIQLLPTGIEKIWQSLPLWIDQILKWIPENLGAARETLLILQERLRSETLQIDLSRIDLSEVSQQASPIVGRFLDNFFALFNNAVTVTLQLLLVFILTLMLLADPQSYRQAFLALFPSFYRRRADRILTHCEIALGNWFAGIIINSLFVGTLSGVGLWFLGIDLALAHALLAGLLNFIPNIGPVLSVIFPLSVAIQTPSWRIWMVIVLYVVVQQVESYWLTPTVMARQVSLLPALTLIAQICFATLFGLLGLILALPLAVVAKVWIQELLVRDILDGWQP